MCRYFIIFHNALKHKITRTEFGNNYNKKNNLVKKFFRYFFIRSRILFVQLPYVRFWIFTSRSTRLITRSRFFWKVEIGRTLSRYDRGGVEPPSRWIDRSSPN